ncbi:MAG TPA: glycerol dehydrogenase [Lachnospiraceae bacterium]|nr:glycerol dehydrogenase [Lachnospiraceae bacterium]
MSTILAAPGKYIQGRGELKNLSRHISALGKKALIIASELGVTRIQNAMDGSDTNDCALYFESFEGECSMTEINRMQDIFHREGCDIVVGAGGGKVLDTAKATACFLNAPCVIVPTAVSSDAPCSALSVIYHDDGSLDQRLALPKSPDIILIDSELIAQAPVRLLTAGMGDAFSTYFEARACYASASDNIHGGKSSITAQAIARLCYDTLLADGFKAMQAVSGILCTQAVENIIEANTLLSGIGFESGGKGAAHSIGDGLNTIPECKRIMHGEKVAFGSLAQLMMENASEKELNEAYDFCISVNLPVTLEDLNITENVKETVDKIASVAVLPGKSTYNMPFPVSAESVADAILAADLYGRSRKQK